MANSTPMVDFESRLNSFLVNLLSRFDLPTPESPISTTVGKVRTEIWGSVVVLTLEEKLDQVSKRPQLSERGLTSYSSFDMMGRRDGRCV